MCYTLADALTIEALREARIVSKNHDLSTEVKGINIIEAPDVARWLDGNEIILTNLFCVYKSDRSMRELILSLHEKNVAALIVKINRFVAKVPAILLEEADKRRMAVIEIPLDVRYMDIMYPIMAAVFDNRVIRLSYFKKINYQLTKLSLEQAGIESITKTISSIIDNPVTLYHRDFSVLCASSPEYAQIESRIHDSEHYYENMYYYRNKVELKCRPRQICSQIMIPIKIFNTTRAYLSVVEEKPLTELDYIALQNAVTIICLERLTSFTVEETERKYESDIVEDIVSSQYAYSPALEERAKIIGWNLDSPYCAIIADFTDCCQSAENKTLANPITLENRAGVMLSIFKNEMEAMGLSAIFGRKHNRIIIFAEDKPGFGEENFNNLGRNIARTLPVVFEKILCHVQNKMPDILLNIGFTSESGFLKDMPDRYNAARDALVIGSSLYKNNFQCNYDHMGVFKLLCSHNRNELKSFIPKSLICLHDYCEKKPSGQLLKTLIMFLNNNCNANKTSQDLYIHYKTLQYRLNKIQQITGIDLKNNEELLELQIGKKIMQIFSEDFNI